ncbi:sensor histidine kinase [Leifsonia lichenia]
METVTGQRITDRALSDWLWFSGVATAATVVMILANPAGGFASAALAAAIVLALAPVYWFLARPSLAGLRSDSPRAWAYVAIAIVAYLIALGLNDWTNVALFVLSPQFFLLLRPWFAGAAIVALNAGGLLVRVGLGQVAPSDLVELIGWTVLIIAVSIYFSNRMTTVTQQSEARAALIEQLREQQTEIAALSGQQGAAAERERIAREMHDTLAQGFTSIVTLGHAVQGELSTDPDAARRHVELITETAQENLQESRRIIAAMTPGRLSEGSLAQAVERVTRRFADETGVDARFSSTGTPRPAPPTAEVVVLRVAQEALANVRKHAAAANVSVELAYIDSGDHPAAISLAVSDDGRGFDGDAPRVGYGIDGMASRVREVGGAFELDAHPGAGTTVRVTVPAEEEERA